MTASAILSTSGIYTIRNTVNGKVYVGSAICFKSRFSRHITRLKKGDHHSPKLQKAWIKYGSEAFLFEPLEAVSDVGCLLSREQFWIESLSAFGENGYNMTPRAGSHLGAKRSPEVRANMGKANIGRKHTPEAMAKIIQANRNRPPATEETRAKIAAAHKGKKRSAEAVAAMVAAQRLFYDSGKKRTPVTEETRRKISESGKGRGHTPEAAAKIAAAHRGVKRPPMSKEWKEKIAASLSKNQFKKVSIRLNGVVFESQAQAAIASGLTRALVCKMVRDGRAERV